jgi:hypothetical protein
MFSMARVIFIPVEVTSQATACIDRLLQDIHVPHDG